MTSIREQLAATDSNGNTPLHRAAKMGLINHVEDYLEKGADPNAMNNEGRTPLDVATMADVRSIIERILLYQPGVAKPLSHQITPRATL